MSIRKLKIHPVKNSPPRRFFGRASAGAISNGVHFIGIGGIGVSALARYYLAKGHKVSGSDLVSSEITESLKKSGVKIVIGENKIPENTDLIIYSPAVPARIATPARNTSHNEAGGQRVAGGKIPILSYPEALGELTKQYHTIAVSGTHGKSTTTAMLSLILIKAGLDPTVIIGTKLKEFKGTNFRMGRSKYLIIEADEHFASFLNYWPKMIVLTNIDADHLDYYKNIGNIVKTFKKYIAHLPKDGVLVANRDDKNTRKILGGRTSQGGLTSRYSLKQPDAKKIKNILKIPGDHMVSDALAALTAARVLGVPDKISLVAISEYNGAWRRFEILQKKPFVLISDYGHNPVKMLATLKGAREKYPRRRICCVYQPHQYQRTYFLFKEFVKAFRTALQPVQGKPPADNIIITDIYDVAGREEKAVKKEINSEKLVKAINKPFVIYLPTVKIVSYLRENVNAGDVVIIMGAGDIYKLCDKLI